MYFSITDYILNICSCALSTGSLACFNVAGQLSIGSLLKSNNDRLSTDIIGEQIEAIPGSPIPAFIVTNKNVEKLVYVKDNKILVRSLTTRASSFIYTYMADRHILLQISSPIQVCIIYFYIINNQVSMFVF